MRNKVIWSFLSLVALATGGLVGGCNSDAKLAKSAEGDSCTKTADCNDGLRCEQGTCFKATSHIDNSAGAPSGAAGEPGVVAPTPPVLGGPGESCTKRADCEDGLSCLSQRCTMDGGGAGGAGNVGPTLGTLGETCVLTSDCDKGLSCLPGTIRGEGFSTTGVGVCTPIDSGITPPTTVCGAECVVAADCCELPVLAQGTTGASSCSDLAALVGNIANCDTAVGVNGAICLAYNSYCDDQCGKNTWACDGGLCNYAAKCTKATEVVGGCPPYTRGGHPVSPCDVKVGKCQPAATVVVGCTSDAKCDAGLPVADHAAADVCSKGECACHVESGGCYRKCNEPTDCLAGYTCDDKTSLCVLISGCTSDTQCIADAGDYRVKCVAGTCTQPPCEHDIDCNPGGLVDGTFRSVCGPDKTCVVLSTTCSSSDECGQYTRSGEGGGVRAFCGPPVTTPTTVLPVSAITD